MRDRQIIQGGHNMKASFTTLCKKFLPIFSIIILLVSVFSVKNFKPNTPVTVIDDQNVPLATLSPAYFFVVRHDIPLDSAFTLTDISLTDEDFDFIGEGTVLYENEIFNNPDEMTKAIQSSPDFSHFITEGITIEWRFLLNIDGTLGVIGVYTEGSIENNSSDKYLIDAQYYLFNPSLVDEAITNVLPTLCDYIGSGKAYYHEDIYNDPNTLNSLVAEVPPYEAPAGVDIEWGSIYEYNGDYIVIGRYISSTESETTIAPNYVLDEPIENTDTMELTVRNIEELKSLDIEVGCTVYTEGYADVGDNGNAAYIITDSPDYNTDNVFVIPIKNKKYAQMLFDADSIINVACAGIYPDTQISSKLNTLVYLISGKARGIQFNSGTYYLESAIYLQSTEWYGTGDTLISVSPDFSNKRYGIITNTDSSGGSFTFEGINFEYNSDENFILADCESALMALTNITYCHINNCTFTATNAADNETGISLLWFRHCDQIENVTIENSKFYDLIGYASDQDKMLRGGCIWFNGPGNNHKNVFKNIIIRNCELTHVTSDEAIAFWNGSFHDVTIEKSTIKSEHKTNNILAFHNCSYHNVEMNKVDFISSCKARTSLLLEYMEDASDILIHECSFDINAENASPYTDAKNVIFINNDDYASLIDFRDNTVISSKGTTYGNLVTCYDSTSCKINVIHNVISVPTLYGVVYITNSTDVDAHIFDNTISGAMYISATDKCTDSNLSLIQNRISDGQSLLIKSTTSLNYNVKDNDLNSISNSNLITYQSTSKASSNITLSTDNNN